MTKRGVLYKTWEIGVFNGPKKNWRWHWGGKSCNLLIYRAKKLHHQLMSWQLQIIYPTYLLIYCKQHIQMTNNHSIANMEAKNKIKQNTSIVLNTFRNYTTLYHTYHSCSSSFHSMYWSTYSFLSRKVVFPLSKKDNKLITLKNNTLNIHFINWFELVCVSQPQLFKEYLLLLLSLTAFSTQHIACTRLSCVYVNRFCLFPIVLLYCWMDTRQEEVDYINIVIASNCP